MTAVFSRFLEGSDRISTSWNQSVIVCMFLRSLKTSPNPEIFKLQPCAGQLNQGIFLHR